MCYGYKNTCVLELVQAGISFDEIVEKYYPDITFDDIKACIQYAVGACYNPKRFILGKYKKICVF